MTDDSDAGHQVPRLRRDAQQWVFDRAIRDDGRVYHFQLPGRGNLPDTVKSHAMISKKVGEAARRFEALGDSEAAVGHRLTALEFYFDAAVRFANAQHPIFAVTPEKKFLHESAIRCYDRVREYAPYVIEHVHVPWEGTTVSGYLHLAPGSDPAPLIFFIPGCDTTKEMSPHPLYNWAIQRGMHVFVFDGPGQGESNLRGIQLTVDNYERAASAALTQLLNRPEIEADRVGLYGLSFGSYWAARFAATDKRISATALIYASICDKYHQFEVESPRYKQLFAFLTGAQSEEELDTYIGGMGLEEMLPEISCPTLLTVGQFDPRSPIEEFYELYDTMTAPTELWMFEDLHHQVGVRGTKGLAVHWAGDHHSMAMDWLVDRMSGEPVRRPGQTVYVRSGGVGPNDPGAIAKRRWFEEG